MKKILELPIGHPERKFRGRLVFGGNDGKDERARYVILPELSSNPATLEASKAGVPMDELWATAWSRGTGNRPTHRPHKAGLRAE